MAGTHVWLFVLFTVLAYGQGDGGKSPEFPSKAYPMLLQHALDEHQSNNHKGFVDLMNEAIRDYKFVQETTAQCWLKCQGEFTQSKLKYINLLDGQMNNLHYSIKMKVCSDSCKEKVLGKREKVNPKAEEFFQEKEPYKFLQFAYSQMGAWDDALACAYTYLEAHPDDQQMANIVVDLKKKSTSDAIRSLEEPRHIALYRLGEIAYFQHNYSVSIDYFEESHLLFFKELDKCLARCEERVEPEEMFHVKSLFEHYQRLIACRQRCRVTLTTGNIDTTSEKFVNLYYDFLGFAYYQRNRLVDAASCTLSALILLPGDEKMTNNLKFYRSKPEVRGVTIKPKKQTVKYHRQLLLESSLITIAKGLAQPADALGGLGKEIDLQAKEELRNVHESVLIELSSEKWLLKGDMEERKVPDPKNPTGTPGMDRQYRDQGRWKNHPDVKHSTLLMEERELNGTNRVAFDDVIDQETCEKLKALVKKIATFGDGYTHSHEDADHPFTEKESFMGVTVGKAVEAYEQGKASYDDVAMYFNISDKVRVLAREYFNLDVLNIAYTHLVCREALTNKVDEDDHISHPVHSDNCNINEDGLGTCPKRSPAYTWRDYSGILYLNDDDTDFVGGDFIFADYNNKIQARLRPTCGRMVAFRSNGLENLHGVLGVKSGIRCALPMWFTLSDVSEDQRGMHEEKFKSLGPDLLPSQVKNEL